MRRTVESGFLTRLLLAAALILCPLALVAQTSDSAARVVSLTGQVSVIKDNVPWAMQSGDLVHVRQLIRTGPDGFAVLQVSDGSTFEVFPNSQVIFRSTLGNWSDLIDLVLGRVKLHVQKIGGRPNPNRVHTPTAVISVRGTVFDVAIEDEDTTLVSVDEGQVAVRHRLLAQSEPKLVNAGEYIRVFRNQPLAQKSVDKGTAVRTGLRALADVFYSVIYRGSRTPGGASGPGGGGPTLSGDTGATPPPPPPPPPTAPPPPPGQN